jgi:hypothetical protein
MLHHLKLAFQTFFEVVYAEWNTRKNNVSVLFIICATPSTDTSEDSLEYKLLGPATAT